MEVLEGHRKRSMVLSACNMLGFGEILVGIAENSGSSFFGLPHENLVLDCYYGRALDDTLVIYMCINII
jgi:hypothetical protein